MNQKTRFPLDTQPKDQPIADHPFYLWLVENENTLDTRHNLIIFEYLRSLDFDKDKQKVDGEVVDELRMVQDYYGRCWMPRREPASLKELFVPGNPDIHANLFWLRDGNRTELKTDKVALSDTLRDLIDLSSPIYDLEPRNYYFEVIKGVLFIKYQDIIGSRRICPITEVPRG